MFISMMESLCFSKSVSFVKFTLLTRVRDNFRLKECQLHGIFDMHRQSFRLIVKEAVCGECRTDVHYKVVYRAVS